MKNKKENECRRDGKECRWEKKNKKNVDLIKRRNEKKKKKKKKKEKKCIWLIASKSVCEVVLIFVTFIVFHRDISFLQLLNFASSGTQHP